MSHRLLGPAAVFLALAVGRNIPFFAFAAARPDSLVMDGGRTILWGDAAPVAAAAAGLAALLLGGRRLMRRLRMEPDDASALGLGLGVFGTALLAAGLTIGLSAWVAAAACAAAALPAAAELASGKPKIRPWVAAAQAPPWRMILEGALAYALWNTLVGALAPPMDWDVLAYHLALPKLYLRLGEVRRVPWMLHSHWPHLMELFYAVPLSLGGEAAAALLHAGVAWAWVLAVYAWAKPKLGETAAFLGAALLAAQPAFLSVAPSAHSDGGQALFFFLSAQALWSWRERGERGRLLLAGVFGGLAAACKLSGALLPCAEALWIAAAGPGRPRARIKDAAVFLAAAGLCVAPWYLKTALETGDPVWPFLTAWTGGETGGLVAAYEKDAFWRLPADLGLLLNYGPQFLLVPAAALVGAAALAGERLPRELRFLLAPAAVYFAAVARQKEAWRFFMPCYPALALSAGWALDRLLRRRAAFAAALVFWVWTPLKLTQRLPLFPVLGAHNLLDPKLSPRDAYLSAASDHYAFFKEAKGLLPEGSRVLLFREIRGYYLDADYLWGDPLNQRVVDYDAPDAEALARRLDALGVTHVLVNEGISIYREREGYYGRRILGLMAEVLGRRGRLVLRRGALSLYAVAPVPARSS